MSEFKCNNDCSCCEILCSDAIEKNNQSLDVLMELLKQKDAEIEKKDKLLEEAVEVIKILFYGNTWNEDKEAFNEMVRGFLNKMEVGNGQKNNCHAYIDTDGDS